MRSIRLKVVNGIRVYREVVRLVWEASPRYSIATLVLTIIRALLPPALIWLAKLIIDEITLSIQVSAAASAVNWSRLIALVGGMCVLWALDKVTQNFQYSTHDLLGQLVNNHVRSRILEKAARLDMAFFENPAFFNQMENALREIWRTWHLSHNSFDLIGQLVSLVALMILLSSQLHPLIALLLVVTSAPQLIARSIYTRRLLALYISRSAEQRVISYITHLMSANEFVKELRLFSLHDLLLGRLQGLWDRFFRQDVQMWRFQFWADLLASLVSALGLGAVWIYAVMQAVAGYIGLGAIVVVLQTAEQSRERMHHVFYDSAMFYEHALFVKNLFDFLNLPPDSVAGALQRPPDGTAPLPVPDHDLEITFCNVSFRYPGAETWTLRDVSFTLGAGERVALVGDNGAGKTTIVKLVARLYDPTEGQILLNGEPLTAYSLDDLRARIGVIFQDFVRYHFTAGENIGLARVDRMQDEERIWWAAGQGGALPVIDKLPRGLETPLGKTLDEGTDLSGGEWQKLALFARPVGGIRGVQALCRVSGR